MFLTNLFKFKLSCPHDKVSPHLEQAYCPDCGKLIQNEWYITRCECCGLKLRTVSRGGNIVPQENYCSNCGSQEFIVEKLDKINFIDINFATLVKRELKEDEKVGLTTQCWEEKISVQQKLLGLYQ